MSEATQAPDLSAIPPEVAAQMVFGFDIFSPGFREDPYSAYEQIREAEGFHLSPVGIWVFARHEECSSILHSSSFSSDQRNSDIYKSFMEQASDTARRVDAERQRVFLFLDPPDHTRLRGLVSKAFTPRTVNDLKSRIEEIVKAVISDAKSKGGMDVIEDLAYPLPVTIISEMLGVPPEDFDTFKGWSGELARSLDPDIAVPDDVIRKREGSAQAFRAYFSDLIEDHRKTPKDDLLSALIAAEDQGDKLTHDELLSTCVLLLIAGHETTVSLIGNGFLAMANHPDQFEALTSDPSKSRAAVEEVLRYDPPVQLTGRVALEDVQVGDSSIPSGSQTLLLLGAANRDPRVYEDPDSFDIGRGATAHLSFGAGIHFCLGAPLARLEARIAFEELAKSCTGIELDGKPAYRKNIVLRGLSELPITLS
jgi:hypothetical protein